ncbi:calcium-binding protein [Thiohalorhabdus sp. Cl-TMA]|uniref:Calcium-binding protein n=1 Tax=Thiohalorhabdus methylotrophus TaxID=3242694 RepID=A0ABV4U186_9GAMM
MHIEGFDPDDPYGQFPIDTFRFSGGAELTYRDLLARGFDLYGTVGDDVIRGTVLNDRIRGKAGDDRLIGKAGDDRLIGGAGVDVLEGGIGTDRADYSRSSARVSVNLATGSAIGGTAAGDTLSGIEGLIGSAYGDSLTGDLGDNPLVGRAGDDRLLGGRGDDRLAPGAGQDLLFGGWGTDTADYSGAASGTRVDLALGYARKDGETDVLASIEAAQGSAHADALNGDWGENYLAGGAGDDRLAGRAGADELVGGAGNDIADYRGSWVGVSVDLAGDTALGGTARGDSLTGIESLAGSRRGDRLAGDDGANVLAGRYGKDHLDGAIGTDWLRAGIGWDSAEGGAGNDALEGGYGRDSLVGGVGNDLLAGGVGNDEVSTGGGANMVLHNRDGGRDRVDAAGTDRLTVSLGGGIALEDLSLTRHRNDLILNIGERVNKAGPRSAPWGKALGLGEEVIFEDWYASASCRPDSVTLQMVTEATGSYDPNADKTRLRDKLNRYDFTKIVEAFDQAKGGRGRRWDVMDSALANHLEGSDTEALGGELVHRYGVKGSLEGVSRRTVLATLADERFGEEPQSLKGTSSG